MDTQQQKQVIQIIADTLGVDDVNEITRSAEFIADLNASVDEIEHIVKTIENRFDIDLGIEDIDDLVSVNQLLELIDEAFI